LHFVLVCDSPPPRYLARFVLVLLSHCSLLSDDYITVSFLWKLYDSCYKNKIYIH
jgi:hypothetical protein